MSQDDFRLLMGAADDWYSASCEDGEKNLWGVLCCMCIVGLSTLVSCFGKKEPAALQAFQTTLQQVNSRSLPNGVSVAFQRGAYNTPQYKNSMLLFNINQGVRPRR